MDAGARGIEVERRLSRQNLSASVRVTGDRRLNPTDRAHKATRSPEVREASFEDYPQIAALESKYDLEPQSYEEWKHLWVNNPLYRQLAKSWPLGWVLEDSNREIVGYIGNIPLAYEFEGKKLLAATGRAWVVDSRYRSYSILLMDYFFAQTNVDLYLNTTLNIKAAEGFRFFGPLPVPVGDWDRTSFWITNYAGFLASSLKAKKVPFAKALSYPLSVPLFFKDQFTRRRLGKYGMQVNVQTCSGFDERFDTFWEDLKRSRSQVLLGTRTREILDWHFKYLLLRNKAWIFCVTDGPRLIAYSVFYRQDNIKVGLKRVRLADFQTLVNDNSLLLPMLSCALERCRCNGIHMLEILGLCPKKTQIMAKLVPYRRKLSSWLYFYKTTDKSLAEKLSDPSAWDPSQFDGDASL
jgi:hypothetical protein